MLRSVHCGVRRYQIGGDAHTKAELCLFVSGPCVRMASPLALPLFASFASTHRPLFLPLAQVAVPPPPWLTSHTPLVPSRTSPHSRRQRVSKHSHSRPPRLPPNRPRPHPLPATRPSPPPDHTTVANNCTSGRRRRPHHTAACVHMRIRIPTARSQQGPHGAQPPPPHLVQHRVTPGFPAQMRGGQRDAKEDALRGSRQWGRPGCR